MGLCMPQHHHIDAVTHSKLYLDLFVAEDVWLRHGNYESRELGKEKDDDRDSG